MKEIAELAKSAKKQITRRPASAQDVDPRGSTLVLLGDQGEVEAVRPAFSSLLVDLEWLPAIALPTDSVEIGVVVVSLEGSPRPVVILETLRTLTHAPVFVVVGDQTSDRAVRRMYDAGAAAVFEWPLEALLIGRYIAEILALRFVRGRAAKPDVALARTVRSHFKLLPGLAQLPEVDAKDGVVAVAGHVESLRLKREIERCAANIPGVRSLDLSDLRVLPVPVPDDRIRRAARRLIEASADIDPSTLALKLEDGRLIIEGSVPSLQAARMLEERAVGIAGLRGVENQTRVSKKRQRADRGAARRIRTNLESVYPVTDLRVSFFDGTALLSGSVESLRVRRDVVGFVSEDPAVERVVDKLDVER